MTSKAIARIVPINGNEYKEFYAATLNHIDEHEFNGIEVDGTSYSCLKKWWKVEMLPMWNGEGLPPVGTECEYTLNNGSTWNVCTINTIVGTQGVVMNRDVFEGVQYVSLHDYPNTKFRPIRSARDKAVEAMFHMLPEGHKIGIDTRQFIYDAIAAGKIPGVKLDD